MMIALENAVEQNRDIFAAWSVLLVALAILRFPRPVIAGCLLVAVGFVIVSFVVDVIQSNQPELIAAKPD